MKSLGDFLSEVNKCPKGYYFDDKSKSCQPKKSVKIKSYGYPRFGGGSKNGNGDHGTNGNSGNGNGNGNGGNGGHGNGGGGNGGNGGGE